MYFSLLQVIQGDADGEMPIELAISHDGYTFDRPFRDEKFLPVTHCREDFDGGVIWSNATPVILEDEIRFYYGAYSGVWGSEKELIVPPTGIGLATMPKDRFAGLRPDGSVGQITTRAFDLSGCSGITINADAGDGSIRLELLTESGRRVRQFTKDDATALRGDSLRHEVRWRDRRADEIPAGRYLIRIHLEDAQIFAATIRGITDSRR